MAKEPAKPVKMVRYKALRSCFINGTMQEPGKFFLAPAGLVSKGGAFVSAPETAAKEPQEDGQNGGQGGHGGQAAT